MTEPLRRLWQNHHTAQPRALQQRAAGCLLQHRITALDISASHIRSLLLQGKSCRYLVPEPVREYIDQHHLYESANP